MNPLATIAAKVPRPLPEVVLGPVTLAEGVVALRSPRLSDAAAWSATRLANRDWLEGAFPAWGEDWAAEQSPAAWVRRWRHLDRVRRRDGAAPFVVTLDGRLIGELGIDAVDSLHGGEGSVWLVRDHGSAAVMNVVSLLMLQYAFTRPDPLDRVLSPVLTALRRGRTPGLTAVGFEIEATLPRAHGAGEAADYDIWVVHNTAAQRTRIDQALAAISDHGAARAGRDTTGPGSGVPARAAATARAAAAAVPAVVQAVVGEVGNRVRRQEPTLPPPRRPTAYRPPVPIDLGGNVWGNGIWLGRLDRSHDRGTSTATVVPHYATRPNRSITRAMAEVIVEAADQVDQWGGDARWVQVRLLPETEGVGPHLAGSGFEQVATMRGNPESATGYPGEQIWLRPVG